MDPRQIYNSCIECVEKCCANLETMGISKDEIKSIGLANQRETSICWDRQTGKPLYNAIVWLDTRTTDLASELIERTPEK